MTVKASTASGLGLSGASSGQLSGSPHFFPALPPHRMTAAAPTDTLSWLSPVVSNRVRLQNQSQVSIELPSLPAKLLSPAGSRVGTTVAVVALALGRSDGSSCCKKGWGGGGAPGDCGEAS